MTKLNRLDAKLMRAVSLAALGAEAPAPSDDEDAGAEGDDEESAEDDANPKSRRSKKVGKRSRRAEQDDEETAEGEDEDVDADDEDDQSAEDEDPDAEDDLDPDAEDEDPDAEDDDEQAEDDSDEPKSRRGKKATRSATGLTGERARIAAITRSSVAAGREGLADYLAFSTNLSAKVAFGILKNAPKAKAVTSLRTRMASIENPKIKSGSGRSATQDETSLVQQSASKTAQEFGF